MSMHTPKEATTAMSDAGEAPTMQAQARALGDPTRYGIFRYLVEAATPVGVRELTAHFALNHNAIRQHLAKLVSAGLVRQGTAPAAGPGRPRLEFSVNPAADSRWSGGGPYQRLSLLLVEMLTTGDSAVAVGRRAGRALVESRFPDDVSSPGAVSPGAGSTSGAAGEAAFDPDDPGHGTGRTDTDPIEVLTGAMANGGFAPTRCDDGDGREMLVLERCPFADTAEMDPDTVCAIHLGLAEGVASSLDGLVIDTLERRPPRIAGCRLRLHEVSVAPAPRP